VAPTLPFKTHHNALDQECSPPRRAVPQALLGGFERVFEINRNTATKALGATTPSSP
jgi:lysyl-tRNA synthetase class II